MRIEYIHKSIIGLILSSNICKIDVMTDGGKPELPCVFKGKKEQTKNHWLLIHHISVPDN